MKALGLSPPPTGQSTLGQINTALLPEPHDLDPFAPLGIRLGSFLLFPELDFGADLTNNVLDTKFDTKTDWGPEIKPRVRLDSDWGRHYWVSRPMPTASGTPTSRSPTPRTTRCLLAGDST